MVVPVPTYFSIGRNALPGSIQQKIGESGGEVTDNLVFLGQLPPSDQSRKLNIRTSWDSVNCAGIESG
jgi:hypothetical protein